MKVRYYCGGNVYPRGRSVLFDEPSECGGDGIINVDNDDWSCGYVTHTCPFCGTRLEQADNHFEEVST